ncbi:MAG: Trm112 family protein [Thermoleophilaceae bacterium]|nr:Trm112 family protein [Thermoleophilaceae bacterium]
MANHECPVCGAGVSPGEGEGALECPGCAAKLELRDDGSVVLQGDAPAG